MSGLQGSALNTNELDARLMSNEIIASIRKIEPLAYDKIFEYFQTSLRSGESLPELNAKVNQIIISVFHKILPQSSDENIIAFANLIVKHSKTYRTVNPEDCFVFLNGKASSSLSQMRESYPEMANEEDQLELKVLKEYSGQMSPIPIKNDIEVVRRRVLNSLAKNNIDANIIASDNIAPREYDEYCKATIAFYGAALSLPKRDAASFMRYLFSFD
jgi:hypothetical protein